MTKASISLFMQGFVVAILLTLTLSIVTSSARASSVRPQGNFVAPQNSAVACWGDGCFGRDPYASGCNKRMTVTVGFIRDSASTIIATIWNRYSIDCNANWTEAQITAGALKSGFSMILEIYQRDQGFSVSAFHNHQCYPDSCSGGYGGSLIAWTNMINGTNVTRSEVFGEFPGIFGVFSGTTQQ